EMVKGGTQGKMMPMSLNFALDNVDGEKALAYINDYEGQKKVFNDLVFQAREEGYCMARWYFFDRSSVDGTISVNNGGPIEAWDTGMDGTSVQDLVIVERLGIKIATDFVRFCRDKKIPGLENCSLMRVGANVGVRETRRIVGDYVFSEKDATEGTKFEDAIVRRYGERIDSQNLEISKNMVSGHQLPYRCLLPRGIEGLLVAGRCASYDQVALTAGRSMGNMMALGQSAGVAAGLAALEKVTPRNLDVAKAQKALIDMGVDLGL
ncbi:MAG: FAD-dependent oxidoreductase, partial [Candidatus Sumerlaeota bacterium]